MSVTWPHRRGRRARGALVTALVVVGAGLAALAPPQASAAPGSGSGDSACAQPALSGSLTIPPTSKTEGKVDTARRVATTGSVLGAPARAQAAAVAAALAADLKAGPDAADFYKELLALPGWAELPPSIAVHRVLGSADPFGYEQPWEEAVTLLAELAGTSADVVERTVSPGGSAAGDCWPTVADARTLPLPPGSGYSVTTAPAGDDAKAGQEAVTLFGAACGTPVHSASAGTVELTSAEDGGPFVVRVVGEQVTAEYSHVQRPVVEDGQLGLVGAPLAEVGDLGDVDRCAVGLRMLDAGDNVLRAGRPLVDWLAKGTGGVLPPPQETGGSGSGIGQPDTGSRSVPATQIRVASYNVLGAHLTGPGSDRPSYAPGPDRMRAGLARLEQASISIVILNEFETPQANVVTADGDWQLHRATPNNRFRDGNAGGNAIAWRSETWKLLDTSEFTVPWKITLYMPVVLLEHRQSGARILAVGVHNPASTRRAGDQSRARALAQEIELRQITAYREADPDLPVLLIGDFNARDQAFCYLTGTGVLQAAAGGSVGSSCSPPSYGGVDWVFGTTDLDFAGQVVDRSFEGGISDHPLVIADATIPASRR